MELETALEVLISTLVNKSGGVKSSIVEDLSALKPEVYNALSVLLHEVGVCGAQSPAACGGTPFQKGADA